MNLLVVYCKFRFTCLQFVCLFCVYGWWLFRLRTCFPCLFTWFIDLRLLDLVWLFVFCWFVWFYVDFWLVGLIACILWFAAFVRGLLLCDLPVMFCDWLLVILLGDCFDDLILLVGYSLIRVLVALWVWCVVWMLCGCWYLHWLFYAVGLVLL